MSSQEYLNNPGDLMKVPGNAVRTKADNKRIANELIKARINRGKIKASDFQFKNRLTEDQIAEIEPMVIFQWIREHQMSYTQFMKWVNAVWVYE